MNIRWAQRTPARSDSNRDKREICLTLAKQASRAVKKRAELMSPALKRAGLNENRLQLRGREGPTSASRH